MKKLDRLLSLLAFALFAVAGVLSLGFLVQAFVFAHSEIPPEKTWELLTAPALRCSLLQSAALGFFLAGWAALGAGAVLRSAGWRRRMSIAGVVVSAIGALAAFAWAADRANDLMLPGRVCEALDGGAYPGLIRLLDFRNRGLRFAGGSSFAARIELKAGNTDEFTRQSRPAAPGDAADAIRAARDAFPSFRPDPSGRVLSIRPDSAWKGWIVPDESPIRCIILASRKRP